MNMQKMLGILVGCGLLAVACGSESNQTDQVNGGTGGSSQAGASGQAGTSATAGGAGASGSVSQLPLKGKEGPSCADGLDCEGTSCCENLLVPGGRFMQGRSLKGTDALKNAPPYFDYELPEHPVDVPAFYMDKFEVTNGRWRKFAETHAGWHPEEGQGAHPQIPETGWRASWNQDLEFVYSKYEPPKQYFGCEIPFYQKVEEYQTHPINCIGWQKAQAFCISEGGRLPTSAEWEFAAAGGEENRLYPWGKEEPNSSRALFLCGGELSQECFLQRDKYGLRSSGASKFGHIDLAGNSTELTLDVPVGDWYKKIDGTSIQDATAWDPDSPTRVTMGGNLANQIEDMRSVRRQSTKTYFVGFRCVYDVPLIWMLFCKGSCYETWST
jgi:formylglycine-generating enzyme